MDKKKSCQWIEIGSFIQNNKCLTSTADPGEQFEGTA
jgi:hypothetical protein